MNPHFKLLNEWHSSSVQVWYVISVIVIYKCHIVCMDFVENEYS